MIDDICDLGLERKFCRLDSGITVENDGSVSGYASVFGKADQSGDVVEKGAYGACLKAAAGLVGRVKMLWQHDPKLPIGIWEEIVEDEHGLFVKGRFLNSVQKGAEAMALVQAGAIDGLSIGYKARRTTKDSKGRRLLLEVDLWEVSLVTFPMLPEARVAGKADAEAGDLLQNVADAFAEARTMLVTHGQ